MRSTTRFHYHLSLYAKQPFIREITTSICLFTIRHFTEERLLDVFHLLLTVSPHPFRLVLICLQKRLSPCLKQIRPRSIHQSSLNKLYFTLCFNVLWYMRVMLVPNSNDILTNVNNRRTAQKWSDFQALYNIFWTMLSPNSTKEIVRTSVSP